MKLRSLAALLIVAPSSAFAMNLQEYLKAVQSKNKTVQAYSVQKEAADLRKEAGDISLVPILSANAYYIDDKSPLSQFVSLGAKESKVNGYSLGLQKDFSTGTSVGLSAEAADYDNPGVLLGQTPALNRFGTGSLGVSLSQSLWKDFFGNATRLRWQTEEVATAAEKGRFDLQGKNLLVNAEVAYWDYLYAIENLKISRDSLERAKRIESWTRRRVNDGISERAELLQTQALVSTRQLLLIAVEDDLAAAKQSLRDYLELGSTETLPEMTGDISKARTLSSMVDGDKGRVLQLDAYLSSLEAKASALSSLQVEDSYRPDLVLAGSYNTHSIEENMPKAVANWTNTDRPTAKVSLNFIYTFDTDVKNAARNISKKNALSAKLVSERKFLESESSWVEINRRYSELTRRIEAADQVMRLQDDRAKAEADLFNKGRSVTNNVVNAEEDAGLAKLNLVRLKSEQRKMEAQGRLFVAIEEK
ncbi:TolC family protein [Bdellovibrio svalbardensis]|uniref:TolC family protein n=1 Tax=Bdellovibrio svalbardensis TaxID=2972972 RepID=A0ABT6DSX0_9BACT|nr:TolC family protein [Bdellovibrio svalbardensis]MDG0818253.1 TolC family protein [Bdellovibrio svalbardensis]